MGAFALVADAVFDGENLRRHGAVVVEGEHVVAVARHEDVATERTVRLPPGTILAPGFIDVQVNGGGGILLNDSPTVEGIATIASTHRRFGTTGLLPTLISDSREAMRRAIEAVAESLEKGVPGVLGIHLEGPFLNADRKGVHPPEHILAMEAGDIELVSALGSRGITLVTLAPEVVPAGCIAELTRRGVIVCAGHTQATAAQVLAAIDEGLTGVTHLYNAMSQLGSREPGAVGATLATRDVYAGIIPDGRHVADLSLKLSWIAKGTDRLMIVTDAMPPVGTALREFSLFGRTIQVREGRCTTADGTLAGANVDMASAVRYMARQVGVGLEAALAMASRTPAEFLGMASNRGRLVPGAAADIVALDPDLRVLETWIAGRSPGSKGSS
jgi:N-acetylglucosamine-6-phosphate deacetylase